ncbi:MAG: hypothetical protein KGJ87_01055 [Planctomycetota bacterium]|nr:hypothetical protein [Planctomycetota bacterium]MDE1888914.1 hypothetical protein [Planctomycetota bacterium]MDE2215744.1 hypothetical protein [Planctomycetota bacterium]
MAVTICGVIWNERVAYCQPCMTDPCDVPALNFVFVSKSSSIRNWTCIRAMCPLPFSRNGIQKVRGSNPLNSTIQGFVI